MRESFIVTLLSSIILKLGVKFATMNVDIKYEYVYGQMTSKIKKWNLDIKNEIYHNHFLIW